MEPDQVKKLESIVARYCPQLLEVGRVGVQGLKLVRLVGFVSGLCRIG